METNTVSYTASYIAGVFASLLLVLEIRNRKPGNATGMRVLAAIGSLIAAYTVFVSPLQGWTYSLGYLLCAIAIALSLRKRTENWKESPRLVWNMPIALVIVTIIYMSRQAAQTLEM